MIFTVLLFLITTAVFLCTWAMLALWMQTRANRRIAELAEQDAARARSQAPTPKSSFAALPPKDPSMKPTYDAPFE